MKRTFWLVGFVAMCACAGCNSDIVCMPRLKMLEHKCVYVAPIESQDPHVGKVIRDVIEKEFMRKKVELCDPNMATIFISGTTFLTVRPASRQTAEAIESVSVVAKDKEGEVLLSASYDNKNQYTASRLAQEFGRALAGKLR